MDSTLHEQVIPYVPAFTLYEKALVEWFKRIYVPRDHQYTLQFEVEYAGGERAVRAIEALKGNKARNDKARTPLITIRLQDVKYNAERYHPPESYAGIKYDGPRGTARRAARISKPAPYKLSYDVSIYPSFEVDLRYAMGVVLNKFHTHGGISYVQINRDPSGANGHGRRQLYPLTLLGYSHNVDSNQGEGERQVRGSLMVEMDAYLDLPYQYVPTFRRMVQEISVAGGDTETVEIPAP